MEEVQKQIESLVSKYKKENKPEYYLGMSDEDARAEEAKCEMASEILSDLNDLLELIRP